MAYIRGNDTNTLVEIAPEDTWGTAPAYGYLRVHPLVEDSLYVERSPLPRSREFGAGTGALTTYDAGRAIVRGGFSVYPVYNGVWFGNLLGQLHGGLEVVTNDKLPSGSSAGTATGFATHLFTPQSFKAAAAGSEGGVSTGFTIRVWKSGPSTAGSVDIFSGCLITSAVWEQPDNERPRMTFTFIGKAVVTTAYTDMASSVSAAPAANDSAANWLNHANAQTNDSAFATTQTLAAPVVYRTYTNLSNLPTKITGVTGLAVRIDAAKTDVGGTSTLQFTAELSWDDGVSWTSAKTTANLTSTEASYTLGGAADLWGRAGWTQAEVASDKVRVRIKGAGSVVGTPIWMLEYVVVTVYYSEAPQDAQSGQVEIALRDFCNRPTQTNAPGLSKSAFASGTSRTWGDLSTTGFRINFDGHLDTPPAFLNSLDTLAKPGHAEQWECSGEVRGILEHDRYMAVSKVAYLQRSGSSGALRFRYVSNTNAADGGGGEANIAPYAFDIYIPYASFGTGEDPLAEQGVNTTRYSFSTMRDAQGVGSGEAATTVTLFAPWILQTVTANQTSFGYAPGINPEGLLIPIEGTTSASATTATSSSWTDKDNALLDDSSYAKTSTDQDEVVFSGFDFSAIPDDATILGITVRMDGWKDETAGSGIMRLGAYVSDDSGVGYSTAVNVELTTSEYSYTVGNDLWGLDWTVAEVKTAFRLKVKANGTIVDTPEWRLDYVSVTVRYEYYA